ncbi:DUF309 domain-containing protein [Paenibacillus alkaliterrae]|uniref:DUF309 domain-containing protein n=1 Tax=Paenibacillus alkaliterrae TaxID=320909 RepID=UPI001F25C5A8|nr:DUF309 domain-containing protein [Paenibacillus alkaliterrae]MCF2938327.1 DUF309 domain-containing protein [Paenibacillus alkaliterrae]
MITFPNAYVSYLVEFHASRDYFECHELLEEYWKEHPGDGLADTWVGFIQLAVGLYHERRGNKRGALKMLEQTERRLTDSPLESLGIEKKSLLEQLSQRLAALRDDSHTDYADIDLNIINDELWSRCLAECAERGWEWGKPSPIEDASIIQRHKLRDRTDVIAARLAAYEAKKRERDGMV